MRGGLYKLLVAVCLLTAFFTWTPTAVADTVTFVGGYGPYQTGRGGEFTLSPGGFSVSGYATGMTGGIVQAGTFQSFCLEMTEYISANTTYDVVFSNRAINGGVGTSGDLISIGTAYLYSQFARGILTEYDYTNPGRSGAADSSAALLQNAIWWLEGEGGSENAFTALVATMFTDPTADANGAYGVGVLNLYTLAGARAQDQLVLVAVPEPASILGLGTFLLLIGTRLRRKRA